jgi:Abortive infection C-terminus
MHPSQHVEKSLKQILSGCFSIVQGLAAVRNELSDTHGKSKAKHYKLSERHAMFVVGQVTGWYGLPLGKSG